MNTAGCPQQGHDDVQQSRGSESNKEQDAPRGREPVVVPLFFGTAAAALVFAKIAAPSLTPILMSTFSSAGALGAVHASFVSFGAAATCQVLACNPLAFAVACGAGCVVVYLVLKPLLTPVQSKL